MSQQVHTELLAESQPGTGQEEYIVKVTIFSKQNPQGFSITEDFYVTYGR